MLKTDAQAPALAVPLLGGGTFDLSAETPRAFTLVLFYRGKHCPLCTKQMEEDVIPNLPNIAEAGLSVVAVSMDTEDRARDQAQDWVEAGLRVGHGMTEAQARDWGLYLSTARSDKEPALFSEPGMTLVRPDGRVYAHWQQSVPFARPRIADLLGTIGFIVDNDYPARGTAA
ncbi:redoxin domain-containing protein [Jannaschia sp. LMIT008]|uniref:redoxin domain-containing protein n=1 Tax=Jannaschia maritima TaxID=3032585 RepID=UPI00281260BC|nr:redoxin domain-containing protein [Jannaschia sp. LMIT008]